MYITVWFSHYSLGGFARISKIKLFFTTTKNL